MQTFEIVRFVKQNLSKLKGATKLDVHVESIYVTSAESRSRMTTTTFAKSPIASIKAADSVGCMKM
jgi:hypothetical protein